MGAGSGNSDSFQHHFGYGRASAGSAVGGEYNHHDFLEDLMLRQAIRESLLTSPPPPPPAEAAGAVSSAHASATSAAEASQ